MIRRTETLRLLLPALAVLTLAGMLGEDANAAFLRRREETKKGPQTEQERIDYKAYDMLQRGISYLEQKQFEQGRKLISDVPRLFPTSKIRFKAWLALGKHYIDQREYERGIKNLREVEESEDDDEKAEALYQIGIGYYYLNQYDQAFVSLRKVLSDYPWSVYANEAYYYIGLCHFKLGRWAKSVEALKMVGTSVPADESGKYQTEAGQRLFIKVHDKDLVVLNVLGTRLQVQVKTTHGDKEELVLEKLDRVGEYYIGSIQTEPGDPRPMDTRLQILAGDEITVEYQDSNTAEGKRNVTILSRGKIVCTATAAFTDGAYRESMKGVYADPGGGRSCFLRVRDLDRDASKSQDTVRVRLYSQYKPEKKNEDGAEGVDLEENNEPIIRDSVEIVLKEQESKNENGEGTGVYHTGLFVGPIEPRLITGDTIVNTEDDILMTAQGDELVLEYNDAQHLLGSDTRIVEARARVFTGEIPDVESRIYEVDSVEHKARKNLIEAKLYLKLAQIFKDVGLQDKADEKGEEGLERVDEIISLSTKLSLDRSVVEEAFSVKWEIYLVQNKLREAIQVCRTLVQLFPSSSLVDQALFKIGKAKAEEKDTAAAISIFNSILQLPNSEYKAEAQYSIGTVLEQEAVDQAVRNKRPPNLTRALQAYQKCADSYPDSPYAGQALEKIADYYITVARDYRRATELMERVFLEHPDAQFLDTMLLKWAIALYRMQDYRGAVEKLDKILTDYPTSSRAPQAKKYKEVISRKLGE